LNATERGYNIERNFKRFKNPVILPMDGKAFDQHVSEAALSYEMHGYSFFNNDPQFLEWMSWQLNNKGFGRCKNGTVKYTVRGTRTSGVMNTSSGNVLLMCAMVYSYLHSLGLDTTSFGFINDGDDCSIIVEREHEEMVSAGIAPYFTPLGFEMVCEPSVTVLEKLDFCQSSPVFDGTRYIMVRNPLKAVAKDMLCLKFFDQFKGYDAWLSAVSSGGMSLAGRLPIWQEFYRKLGDVSQGAQAMVVDQADMAGFERLAIGMKRQYGSISDHCRVSFWRAFDIDPNKQVLIERLMRHTSIVPKIDEHPVLSCLPPLL
jgi:hypothetical protein